MTNSAKNPDSASKRKGGNDGVSPRALRGAPKARTNWTAADEARFAELERVRVAFVSEREASLRQVIALLFKGAESHTIPAVTQDGNVAAEAKTLPPMITEEQLLENLTEEGDSVLTYLSRHFKLHPTLIKN
jgi:hypothetical protein